MLVIKIGGAAGIDADALCHDIAALWRDGQPMIVVHGGSDETNRLAEQLDHPPRFVTTASGHTSRYTDRRTLEIFAMATAAINRALVERLQSLGVNAIGLSGLDGRLITARRKDTIRVVENGRQRILRDDWTGTPQQVNAELLRLLLAHGYLPIVAPLATSEQGAMLNVDGDRAAAALAGALEAESLLLLSNVAGLLRRFPDESTLVPQIRRGELEAASDWAQGRMKKKLLGAAEALNGGVTRVIIGDGRRANPVRAALDGAGTTITQE
ncbi:MAG: [LysW]-aminoadipate kinase [Chloroflexi bacterium]|nr:[LysW]-aminoadipate kinase [Chloroflexota bacterium]